MKIMKMRAAFVALSLWLVPALAFAQGVTINLGNAPVSSTNPLFTQQIGALPAGTNAIGTVQLGNTGIGGSSGNPLYITGGTSSSGSVSAAGTNGSVAQAIQGITGGVPVPVSGTFSATLSGFTPGGAYGTPLSVTTTSSQTALPAGTVVLVTNTGSSQAYVNLGTSASVTATTSGIPVPAGGAISLTVGSNTNIAAITASGTATIDTAGGTGLFGGYGGGGSGGGGGTVVQGAQGSSASPWFVSQTGALPAGSNTIGAVTQSGTWNIGSITTLPSVTVGSSALPSGAATAAAQTSVESAAGTSASSVVTVQGVAGGVAQPVSIASLPNITIGAALPAGSNSIGTVVLGAGSAAVGSVTVTSSALPAGAATSALQPALNGDGGALVHVTNNAATAPYVGTPLGYQQLTTLTSSTGFSSVPTGATFVMLTVEGAGVRYRDDGTAPTASVGMPLLAGTTNQVYAGSLSAVRFINISAGAIVDAVFYK